MLLVVPKLGAISESQIQNFIAEQEQEHDMDMSYVTGTIDRYARSLGPWRPSRYTAQATRIGGCRCRDTRGYRDERDLDEQLNKNTTQVSTRHITSE